MLKKIATSLLVVGLTTSAYGATHLATHPGTWIIDTEAADGTPTSMNGLNVNAAKHEPHLAIDAAGIMTISVLGTDGAGYHPQGVGHWIDTVFVMDGDNAVICEHEFAEPEEGATDTPTFTCPNAVTGGSATAYEHCNLHGLWVGSTLNVEWEIAAATAAANADNTDNVATGADKHEPFIRTVACDEQRARRAEHAVPSTGCFEVIVLGTDGDQENLHPQDPPNHFIDAVFVKDGHNAVVWYSNDDTGIKQDVAKSVVITNDFAAEGGILTPYEHCNLHGLWVGASFTVQAKKTETPPDPECCVPGCYKAGEESASAGSCLFGISATTCPDGWSMVDDGTGVKSCERTNCPAGTFKVDDNMASDNGKCRVGNSDGTCPAGTFKVDDNMASDDGQCRIGNSDGTCPDGTFKVDDNMASDSGKCRIGNSDGTCPDGTLKVTDDMSGTSKCVPANTPAACQAPPSADLCAEDPVEEDEETEEEEEETDKTEAEVDETVDETSESESETTGAPGVSPVSASVVAVGGASLLAGVATLLM